MRAADRSCRPPVRCRPHLPRSSWGQLPATHCRRIEEQAVENSQTLAAPPSTPLTHEPREPTTKARPPVNWQALSPVAVALIIALIPVPAGLAPHAWYFFAIFAGVIVGAVEASFP